MNIILDETLDDKRCPKCGSTDPHYVTGWSGIGGSYSCEVTNPNTSTAQQIARRNP